jgi:hypothetical protein
MDDRRLRLMGCTVPAVSRVTGRQQNGHRCSEQGNRKRKRLARFKCNHCRDKSQIVRLLISHGADVHAVDNDGKTPRHKAKDEHIARFLISHGADVHAVDLSPIVKSERRYGDSVELGEWPLA